MKKLSGIFIPLGIVVFVLFLFLATKPVEVSRENSVMLKGLVTRISEGASKDIIISLDDIRSIHYISRGIEQGLKVDDLNSRLLNREVIIYYAKPRLLSLLSPMTGTRQITELKLGNKIIYTEF